MSRRDYMFTNHNKTCRYYLANIINAYQIKDSKILKRKIIESEAWLNNSFDTEKTKVSRYKMKQSKAYESFDSLIEILDAYNSRNVKDFKTQMKNIIAMFRSRGWHKRNFEVS